MRLAILSLVMVLVLPFEASAINADKKTDGAVPKPVLTAQPAASIGNAQHKDFALSIDEIYSLQKLKMQQELQSELIDWAQSRFWIIAALGVLVGFFGVRALVREMLATELKDAMRASADAQAVATYGRDAIREMRLETSRYKDEVNDLKATASEVEKQLAELRSRVEAESVRVGAAVELKVNSLEKQITELASSLTRVADGVAANIPGEHTTAERIAAIRAGAESQDESFAANSKYRIVVVQHGPGSRTQPLAQELVDRLSRQGFRASLGSWAKSVEDKNRVVDVEYQGVPLNEVVDPVAEIVRNVLRELGQDSEVKVSEKTWSEEYDFRIFF